MTMRSFLFDPKVSIVPSDTFLKFRNSPFDTFGNQWCVKNYNVFKLAYRLHAFPEIP